MTRAPKPLSGQYLPDESDCSQSFLCYTDHRCERSADRPLGPLRSTVAACIAFLLLNPGIDMSMQLSEPYERPKEEGKNDLLAKNASVLFSPLPSASTPNLFNPSSLLAFPSSSLPPAGHHNKSHASLLQPHIPLLLYAVCHQHPWPQAIRLHSVNRRCLCSSVPCYFSSPCPALKLI